MQCLSQEGVIHVDLNMNGAFLRRVMYMQGVSGSPGYGVVAASTEMTFLEPRHSLFSAGLPQGTLSLLREYT